MPLFADEQDIVEAKQRQQYHQESFLPANATETLHLSDDQQRKKAHHVCGSTTVYNNKGGVRLYCGRRDCAYCFRRRYQKLAIQIRHFAKENDAQLHWQKIPASEHGRMTRSIRRAGGEYICFPILDKDGNMMEYIAGDTIKGHPLHLDHSRLESTLAIWSRTPQGRKVSSSTGFQLPKYIPDKEHHSMYFAPTRLEKMIPHVEKVGGKIEEVSKSYIKWDVNAAKLTDHLIDNDIYAYQLTLEARDTLNGDLREAEDELGLVPGSLTREAFQAMPVDKCGKVKLSHILNNSYGITRHNSQDTTQQPPPS